MFNIAEFNQKKKSRRQEEIRPRKGFYVVGDLFTPLPLHLDQWEPRKVKRQRNEELRSKKGDSSFIDISTPPLEVITLDKWSAVKPKRQTKKQPFNRLPKLTIDFIESIQEQNGNYFDTGVVGFSITVTTIEAQTFCELEPVEFSITPTPVEDFQLEDVEPITFVINNPDTGVEIFNSGVPGFTAVNVIIDGVNETSFVQGVVSVIREDNTAARFTVILNFDQTLIIPRKPVELINKEIEVHFAVADMTGVIADYIPIFIGIIKHVSWDDVIKAYTVTGYDYGGVHQTKGEFISENITTVFEGNIYIGSAGTFNTGHSPIWGVRFLGNSEVTDGTDYFVNTKTGEITVPISSRVLDFPNTFRYSYSFPFNSMRDIIQGISEKKGWIIQEDGVVIADYTNTKEHPVLSLSDESVIDTVRKFLELSGAKVESNLFPNLRVYSEVVNFVTPVNTVTVDDSKLFNLIFNINFDGLLTEQTVRSVQKVNANIEISSLQILAEFEGSQGSLNPNAVEGQGTAGLDYSHKFVLVEKRINRQNISSISFETSGQFSFFTGFELLTEPITASDWSFFIDGDDFVIQLKHRIITSGGTSGGVFTGTGIILIALPAVDYELTVKGSKIEYGEGAIEDVKVVTAQRPVVGITETLRGDVYENAFIETEQHCVNIANAILLEHGNPYTAQFEIPLFEGKESNVGDKLLIERNGQTIFAGIIKILNYSINTVDGANRLSVVAKGVGIGI